MPQRNRMFQVLANRESGTLPIKFQPDPRLVTRYDFRAKTGTNKMQKHWVLT